jgi:hypothetical protein
VVVLLLPGQDGALPQGGGRLPAHHRPPAGLDEYPLGHPDVDNKKDKAKLLYLKGKILDLLPAYEKSAEEYLNKSVPAP